MLPVASVQCGVPMALSMQSNNRVYLFAVFETGVAVHLNTGQRQDQVLVAVFHHLPGYGSSCDGVAAKATCTGWSVSGRDKLLTARLLSDRPRK